MNKAGGIFGIIGGAFGVSAAIFYSWAGPRRLFRWKVLVSS